MRLELSVRFTKVTPAAFKYVSREENLLWCWKKQSWIQFKDKPYRLLYYKRCVSSSVFRKLTYSCWCCLTRSSRFLQTALGLIKIPLSCNLPNLNGKCSLKQTYICCLHAVQFFACFVLFFCASWATVIGRERHITPVNPVRNCFEFRSPTCVSVPVLLVYQGPFEMPAGQDRPVPFITNP